MQKDIWDIPEEDGELRAVFGVVEGMLNNDFCFIKGLTLMEKDRIDLEERKKRQNNLFLHPAPNPYPSPAPKKFKANLPPALARPHPLPFLRPKPKEPIRWASKKRLIQRSTFHEKINCF
jgi:hypothetical protein